MSNPTAAMLVIGDEILSGRTRDTNTNYLAVELTNHGIQLTEARVVADDRDAIIAAVNALRAAYDTVFTSGGIGGGCRHALAAALPIADGPRAKARGGGGGPCRLHRGEKHLGRHANSAASRVMAASIRPASVPRTTRLVP